MDMKKIFRCFILFCVMWAASHLHAEKVFVYLKSGGIEVFPVEVLKSYGQQQDDWCFTLLNDSVIKYSSQEVERVTKEGPSSLPNFTSFKFNNKYNDQVFTDVVATLGNDTIQATVGAIGKSLTPSFNLDQEDAVVTVDGKVQKSKVSRLRFDKDIVYTLGQANWRKMSYHKVKDEVWSDPVESVELRRVPLTADMLSTNAPSNYNEVVGNIVDNNNATFFHSTWGDGMYSKLPLDECPYIVVSLAEDLQNFRFGYTTRFDVSNRMPLSFLLEVSTDKKDWKEVQTYTAEDGIPQNGLGAQYDSPTIRLDEPCRYLRLTMLEASYKNYLCLSEFWIDEVVREGEPQGPVLISPAEYSYKMVPYGRDVVVQVAWPTDTARVPRVYIDVEGGRMPADKETYLDAVIRIDGAGVFPDFEGDVTIKGRGNSSWAGEWGKSPYRLKFSSSQKPFGLTKGKSWVLLANRQTGSMLSNAVAMKVASMVETAGANRIIPVELYMNGYYRGNYNFTQHVGFSNNSIDLDDETNATMLELDSYYDETYKFRSSIYNLPVNVKDPDLTEVNNPDEVFQRIKSDFNHFNEVLAYGKDEYTELVDVEMLARFLLVNELVQNLELGHPKSTYLYKEDLLALHSRYVFGPVWDFDWAFGYEKNSSYCTDYATYDYFSGLTNLGAPFFRNLRYNSEEVKRAYYKEWKDFMDLHLQELLDYVEDYYQYVNPSFLNNAKQWGDGKNYETVKNNTISWLRTRANHIYLNNIDTYDLSQPLPISVGDVNEDGYVSIADVVCILNYLLNMPNESFSFDQADADENSVISINDAVYVIALVMNQPSQTTRHMKLPKADARLMVQNFQAKMGEYSEVELTLSVAEKGYKALQFDLTLPAGFTIEDIVAERHLSDFSIDYQSLESGNYRVVLYSENQQEIPVGDCSIELRLKTEGKMVSQNERVLSTMDVLLSDAQGEEFRMTPHSATFEYEATGVSSLEQQQYVRGGDALYVESLVAQKLLIYALDGRVVKEVNVAPGSNRIELPNGVYIVAGIKVVVGQ